MSPSCLRAFCDSRRAISPGVGFLERGGAREGGGQGAGQMPHVPKRLVTEPSAGRGWARRGGDKGCEPREESWAAGRVGAWGGWAGRGGEGAFLERQAMYEGRNWWTPW